MKVIDIQELRELQMCIMDEIDAFCRKHQIHYTMSGGTLLGAVRHKGFIPWDDDMDIQMLRNDYLHFNELWNKSDDHSDYLKLFSIEAGTNMGYAFAKMVDTRTRSFVKGVERTGVYVDIFPLDKVKDDDDFVKRSSRKRRLYRQRKGLFWRQVAKCSHVPLWRLVLAYFRSPFFPPKTLNEVAEDINRNASEHEGEDCPYYFEMVAGFKCKKMIPSAVFDSYIELPFEKRVYQCVENYHEYLEKTFGDYMKLPPINQRVRDHFDDKFYWKENDKE